MSRGLRDCAALSSLFIVEWIIIVFFSCRRTMRLSTESSITRFLMMHGRDCPILWHRSADCHSTAGFHHLRKVSKAAFEVAPSVAGLELTAR